MVGPQAGEHLLHYHLVEEIGRGGMGVVFTADDSKLRRRVAVKILHGSRGVEARRASLLREAQLASALRHRGVVTIFALESLDDLDFIVMEHVEGESLRDRLRRGPLPPAEVIRIGIELASALAAAHRAGVLHRDIKPSNVLLTPAGETKLVDFGIAQPLDGQLALDPAAAPGERCGEGEAIDTTATLTGKTGDTSAIVGTIAYMSPEQVRGERLDARSDLFSLGATLYEAMVGTRPFAGASPVWVGHAIVHATPRKPAVVRPEIGADLESVVLRLLAKERAARFPSADALLEALRPLAGAAPAPRPRSSRVDRRLIAGAALVGAAGAAWALWPAPGDDVTDGVDLAGRPSQSAPARAPATETREATSASHPARSEVGPTATPPAVPTARESVGLHPSSEVERRSAAPRSTASPSAPSARPAPSAAAASDPVGDGIF